LKERKGFLDGVCITGGEPTLNKELPGFISKIKELGLLVKLDTNGTNPEMLKELIDKKLVDYVAMDIKAPLEFYDRITNVKVKKEDIQKSVDLIRKMKDYEFRITVVPGLFNEDYARLMGEWLKGSKRFYIQQFRGIKTLDKSLMNKKPFSKEELENFCSIMKPYFEKCMIRGI
jgi:pyruvate formate lyase activating enzyme